MQLKLELHFFALFVLTWPGMHRASNQTCCIANAATLLLFAGVTEYQNPSHDATLLPSARVQEHVQHNL